MRDVLQEICAEKREYIAMQKSHISEVELRQVIEKSTPPRGFLKALQKTIATGNPALIAEIKKASPSKGIIREDFSPGLLATDYENGGATCLSVLTDAPYFQGHDDYLAEARNACILPVLRKDFMLDVYQVYEARALGADAILLIMAALSDEDAITLEKTAHQLGMDVLVEVHDEEELARALSVLDSRLIGINNRSLKTLEVSLAVSERLRPMIPEGYTIVCESGVQRHADIMRMQSIGIHTFLVGESLMREQDVMKATKTLIGGAS